MKTTTTKLLLAAIFVLVATGSCFARKHNNHASPNQFTAQNQRPCSSGQTDCFRFSASDQKELRNHYEFNWTTPMPNGDHLIRFHDGERLSVTELRRFQAVPPGYARDVAQPPSGYRLGYYNGMVYAYNPGSGVVADAVDVRY